jgi:hypothetical protein
VIPFEPLMFDNKITFDAIIPETFFKSVEDGFRNADEDILQIANNALPHLNGVHSTRSKAIITSNGLSVPVSHFDPNDTYIYMDETKGSYEYMRTFRHEYGHFVDHAFGVLSGSTDFCDAFYKDAELYDVSTIEGEMRLKNMQSEIADNIHAFASEYVTDIISALTHNDVAFIRKYTENAVQTTLSDPFYYEKMEGAGMSGHRNKYWDGDDGPYMSQQKESFANLFAIRVENNPIVQEFIKEHFPNMSEVFEKIIKNITHEV